MGRLGRTVWHKKKEEEMKKKKKKRNAVIAQDEALRRSAFTRQGSYNSSIYTTKTSRGFTWPLQPGEENREVIPMSAARLTGSFDYEHLGLAFSAG